MSIDYTKHQDTRRNNPTMENRKFFVKEEEKPYDVLYPRDPTLDPQLVWKGKDAQDREDLAVPTVPIYVQEKIHPAQIIGDLKRRAAGSLTPLHLRGNAQGPSTGQSGVASFGGPSSPSEGRGGQISLFDDFNGLEAADELEKLQKSTEFYQHDQHWTNRMILGDSLLVMNSLAEKEGLKGKVQCIYMDPPYGIEFNSNWQVSTRKREVKDGRVEDLAREPEVIRAFRDTWKLGIHSYLAYLRDRFHIALELLNESGSIFVQIGDENVHLVRALLDEVFGSNCAVTTLIVKKKSSQRSSFMDPICDYVLWYTKTPRDEKSGVVKAKVRKLYVPRTDPDEDMGDFDRVEINGQLHSIAKLKSPEGSVRDYRQSFRSILSDYPEAQLVRSDPLTSGGERTNQSLPFTWKGETRSPKLGNSWKHTAVPVGDEKQSGLEKLARSDRLICTPTSWRYKRYWSDFSYKELSHLWNDTGGASNPIYVVQTNELIVQRCILMTTDPGDLVLDPTCGSGTTAAVAERWGRRWITTDTSRVSLALARTRLMCGNYPYYLLADSPEGIKKESEISKLAPPIYDTNRNIRKGFVYRRVPHVSSSSIAAMPDIPEDASKEETDRLVKQNAGTTQLYDRPYDDGKRNRVAGPFTVESLSPHRVLPTQDEADETSKSFASEDVSRTGDFAQMVLENLRKAGVQNTKKGERLRFDDLQPYAGRWVQARGSFTTAEGATKRVAVSVGPEYGAVGPMQVTEAAKEAMQGLGHDVLVVCGYAFDPHVSEEARRIGELTILPARMNADLAMGDELLKKTGAGNLFMVFGEPDLEVRRLLIDSGPLDPLNGEFIEVELKGLDVYDPTTGEIRSNSTADIACWFLDTDYDGESFFVRHAYFVGAEVTDKKDGSKYDPYRALRATLRAEIDEEAWASLYSTVSRPFPIPTSGKIAVKAINHYGDEVLRVYTVTS